MNEKHEKLTIQQVAEATGLIHSHNRDENTHRRYTGDDIGWIDFLTKLTAIGMSIQQMLIYAELQRQGDSTLPERLEMLKAHRSTIEAHMQVLQEHLKVLYYKIEVYQEIVSERLLGPT